eukprot:121839-Prymnesium_polylepis.1
MSATGTCRTPRYRGGGERAQSRALGAWAGGVGGGERFVQRERSAAVVLLGGAPQSRRSPCPGAAAAQCR